MIFTLVNLLYFLSSCFQWHIDGTYKSCLKGFYPLISIHGIKKHMGNDQSVLIPLKTKKRKSYNQADSIPFLDILKIFLNKYWHTVFFVLAGQGNYYIYYNMIVNE